MQGVEAALVPKRQIYRWHRQQELNDQLALLVHLFANYVVQRRVAIRVLDVAVAFVFEQNFHALDVQLVDGDVKSRAAVRVDAIYVGIFLYEKFGDVGLIAKARVVQRRVAISVMYLQVGLAIDKIFDDVNVTLVTADLQRRFARAPLIDDLYCIFKSLNHNINRIRKKNP